MMDMKEEFEELSAVGKKRNLERRRRELMHTRFGELEMVLASMNTDVLEGGAEGNLRNKRCDKEKILLEACECIRKQVKLVDDMEVQVQTTRKEMETLRAEKLELRSDKTYLRNEIQQLRTENGNLRADNIALWQAYRKVQNLPYIPQRQMKVSSRRILTSSVFSQTSSGLSNKDKESFWRSQRLVSTYVETHDVGISISEPC